MNTNTNFQVSIVEYKESHRTTWLVKMVNKDLPHQAWGGSGNPGYMTPYQSEIRERVVHTAKEYALFLGVEPPEECTCIMCVE